MKCLQVPPVYGLDATNISDWDCNVYRPAVEILESYINGTSCSHKQLPCIETPSFPNAGDETYSCEVCERVFVGHFQWNVHRKSKKHKRMVAQKKDDERMKINIQNNSVGSEASS